jgi:hypothetical protein
MAETVLFLLDLLCKLLAQAVLLLLELGIVQLLDPI